MCLTTSKWTTANVDINTSKKNAKWPIAIKSVQIDTSKPLGMKQNANENTMTKKIPENYSEKKLEFLKKEVTEWKTKLKKANNFLVDTLNDEKKLTAENNKLSAKIKYLKNNFKNVL